VGAAKVVLADALLCPAFSLENTKSSGHQARVAAQSARNKTLIANFASLDAAFSPPVKLERQTPLKREPNNEKTLQI